MYERFFQSECGIFFGRDFSGHFAQLLIQHVNFPVLNQNSAFVQVDEVEQLQAIQSVLIAGLLHGEEHSVEVFIADISVARAEVRPNGLIFFACTFASIECVLGNDLREAWKREHD